MLSEMFVLYLQYSIVTVLCSQPVLLAVFKKDTKEKNQKKAEAKKRKAEQQEQQQQQDPGMDDMADTEQLDPDSAFASDQQPARMEAQPSLEPQSALQLLSQMHMPPPTAVTAISEHSADKRLRQSEAEPSDTAMTDAPQGPQQQPTAIQAPHQQAPLAQAPQGTVMPAAPPHHPMDSVPLPLP